MKCQLFLSDFKQNSEVPTNFRKNPKCENSRKSVLWKPYCSIVGNLSFVKRVFGLISYITEYTVFSIYEDL